MSAKVTWNEQGNPFTFSAQASKTTALRAQLKLNPVSSTLIDVLSDLASVSAQTTELKNKIKRSDRETEENTGISAKIEAFIRETPSAALSNNYFQSLVALDLTGLSTINNKDLLSISRTCSSLQEITISASDHTTLSVSDEGITALAMRCAKLRALTLQCPESLTDAALQSLAEGCPDLEKVRLIRVDKTDSLSDTGVTLLFLQCKKLKYFEIDKGAQVKSGYLSLEPLSKHPGKLELETLLYKKSYSAGAFGDKELETVLSKCPKIRVLEISPRGEKTKQPKPNAITDAGVKRLTESAQAPQFESLKLEPFANVSPNSLKLLEKCAALRVIDLSYTKLGDGVAGHLVGKLSVLEDISLVACQITRKTCEKLLRHPTLKRLSIAQNAIDPKMRSLLSAKHGLKVS